MTQQDVTIGKTMMGISEVITIHSVSVKEDYQNTIAIKEKSKTPDLQGQTGEYSAARTTARDRIKIRHSIEVDGYLVGASGNTADEQKSLLYQMMLQGEVLTKPIQLSGLKAINTSGTIASVTFQGLINKVSIDSSLILKSNELASIFVK